MPINAEIHKQTVVHLYGGLERRTKMNQLLVFADVSESESVVLSQRSWIRYITYCMFLFIRNSRTQKADRWLLGTGLLQGTDCKGT